MNFRISWIRSYHEGKDAIKEKIDVKLTEENKLDMDLFKRIIKRSSAGEDILRALNRIEFYSSDFLEKCQTRKRAREVMETSRRIIILPTIKNVEGDLSRMRNQIERCNLYFQKVKIEKDALERLTEVGSKSSLRYSVQLLSLAAQNAKAMKREKVNAEDVERVDKLFMDAGEAAEHLKKYEEKMMLH